MKNNLDFTDELNTFVSNFIPNEIQNKFQWVLLSNGLTEFDENIIFFGFKDKATIPSLVAKVPRLPKNIEVIKTEYARLTDIWNCLGDKAHFYVPKPIALSIVREQPVLITTYVYGENLLRLKIAHNKEQFLPFSVRVAKSLRFLIESTLSNSSDKESFDYNFDERIEKFKEIYQPSEPEVQALYQIRKRFFSDIEKSSSKILIHGDFWHGNIIRNAKDKSLMIVDWQYSRWTHDVSQDVYLFLLAGALSTTQYNDLPEVRAKNLVKVLIDWNKDVIKEYLNAFGTVENYSLMSLRYGMLFCCVEKAVRASIELGFDRKEDLVWYYTFCELLSWFERDNIH